MTFKINYFRIFKPHSQSSHQDLFVILAKCCVFVTYIYEEHSNVLLNWGWYILRSNLAITGTSVDTLGWKLGTRSVIKNTRVFYVQRSQILELVVTHLFQTHSPAGRHLTQCDVIGVRSQGNRTAAATVTSISIRPGPRPLGSPPQKREVEALKTVGHQGAPRQLRRLLARQRQPSWTNLSEWCWLGPPTSTAAATATSTWTTTLWWIPVPPGTTWPTPLTTAWPARRPTGQTWSGYAFPTTKKMPSTPKWTRQRQVWTLSLNFFSVDFSLGSV